MKNLEMMIGQLTTAAQTKPQGAIPSTTITNPKVNEQCKVITLRSGKELERLREQVVHSGPNILHVGADKLLGSQTSHAGADEGSEWATTKARDALQDKEDASQSDTKKKKPLSSAMDPKSLFNFPDCIPPPPFPIEKKKNKRSSIHDLYVDKHAIIVLHLPLPLPLAMLYQLLMPSPMLHC